MNSSEAKRIRKLEKESVRLKKLLAGKELEHRPSEGGKQGKCLSLTRRREAVVHLQETFRGLRASGLAGVLEQPHVPDSVTPLRRPPARMRLLVERMVALCRENPRYAYSRVWTLPSREG